MESFFVYASFSSFVYTTFITTTYNNVDAFFFYIVRNYFLLTSTTITYTSIRHRILMQRSKHRSSGTSFLFAFLDFYVFHSLIYSLSLSFSFVPYIHFLVEIGKKGFFLSKNHLLCNCALSTFLIDTLLGL